MTRFFLANSDMTQFVSVANVIVTERKWARICTESVVKELKKSFPKMIICTEEINRGESVRFNKKDIPTDVIYKKLRKKIKKIEDIEEENEDMDFDPEYLFETLNEKCLKCCHSCKQSSKMTIIQCGDFKKSC